MPIEPEHPPLPAGDAEAELPAPTIEDLVRSLEQMLRRARRVRVFDREGRVEPDPKRRDREPPTLLANLTGADTLAELVSALRLRNTEIMNWMGVPDLWFEVADDHGSRLVTLGLLSPDWLRWSPNGDLRLSAPESLTAWLTKHSLPSTWRT
ncbi:hypothetical protein GCM10023322_10040 [Rugosimonospora acidiphila]|uniref:Uncharacterized protein n=1 Tax=Rugosimonospora acidiphila TaxID=556531 RepID=A0ABP9RM68_9ACTN